MEQSFKEILLKRYISLRRKLYRKRKSYICENKDIEHINNDIKRVNENLKFIRNCNNEDELKLRYLLELTRINSIYGRLAIFGLMTKSLASMARNLIEKRRLARAERTTYTEVSLEDIKSDDVVY